ncbi:TonB-dependent receptor [Pelomyxa schiedti]|nr:TonB-dependent receptor [Pelomyxa schiedti]
MNLVVGCGEPLYHGASAASPKSIVGVGSPMLSPIAVSMSVVIKGFLCETTITSEFVPLSSLSQATSWDPTAKTSPNTTTLRTANGDGTATANAIGDGIKIGTGEEDAAEGVVMMNLPRRGTVCGFSLDVGGGTFLDAVPVEKDRARVSFESELRAKSQQTQGVAEHVRGNVFRMRISPIPRDRPFIVKVVIASELEEGNERDTFNFPFDTHTPCQSFYLKVCTDVDSKFYLQPLVEPTMATLLHGDMTFKLITTENSITRYEAMVIANNIQLPRLFSIDFPRAMQQSTAVVGGSSSQEEESSFFCVKIQMPFSSCVRPKASSVGIIWDKSLSRQYFTQIRSLELLREIFRYERNVTKWLLHFLDTTVHSPIIVTDSSDLEKKISNAVFEGATNLASIQNISPVICDYYVLFSDGFSTWGETNWSCASFSKPIFTVTCETQSDHNMLEKIAQSTGGVFFDFTGSKTYLEFLPLIRNVQYRFVGCQYNTNQIVDVIPEEPSSFSKSFVIAGQLPMHRDAVSIKIDILDPTTQSVISKEAILLPTQDRSGIVSRFWATKKAHCLLLHSASASTETDIVALARKYHFVSSTVSLLLLTTLDQFLRYNVEPPAQYTQLRAQFHLKIAQQQALNLKKSELKFANTLNMWKRKHQLWWTKAYNTLTPQPIWRSFLKYEYTEDQWGDPQLSCFPEVLKINEDTEGAQLASCNANGWDPEPEHHISNNEDDNEEVNDEGTQSWANLETDEAEGSDMAQSGADFELCSSDRIFPEGDSLGTYEEERGDELVQLEPGGEPFGCEDSEIGTTPEVSIASSDFPVLENAPIWAADSASPSCTICFKNFSIMHRRHHCRACGCLVCTACTARTTGERICLNCIPKQAEKHIPPLAFSVDLSSQPTTLGVSNCDQTYLKLLQEQKPVVAPIFFVNAALSVVKDQQLAVRIISNLADIELDNSCLLRVSAAICEQIGDINCAVHLYERAMTLRSEEPQLKPICSENLGRALRLLNTILEKEWDTRFSGIEAVIFMDLNAIWMQVLQNHMEATVSHSVFPQFLWEPMDVDIRIVLTWDCDNTNVELLVEEPSGERCYCFNNQTKSGGILSRDSSCYGPVEYACRQALPGSYKISSKLFHTPLPGKQVVATVHLYVDFARPKQQLWVTSCVLSQPGKEFLMATLSHF